MRIGIIGAMDEEIAFLLNHISDQKEITIANSLFIQGRLAGSDVVLLKSGIGKVNAAMGTTIMHERFSPTYVINTGSAGGFATDLVVGDIVISSHVVHHDVDATAFDYAYGQVPQMPAMYEADADLIDRSATVLKKMNINSRTGVIATGDSFMQDPLRVQDIREKFPSMIAVEMEAAAVAQVCFQYDTPFVIIRALSDIAGKESSISFDEFLPMAAKNASDLIIEMIKMS
ncbi:MAG TPA: 5'-methylthioadenosine/S-adenosylhomocysteine nucleosidase [Virgibacillus sp.]|nr:5'-methylthioadenosine/S-adenosylhomocysteine nucleosidase [Virgibacillus sp.]